MKTKCQLLSVVLIASGILTTFSAQAKIWRVNNRPNIASDFTTAQAAHDSASAGDTIFFEPSPYSYGDITLTKKLIIIGTGYYLDQNPETQWKTNWTSGLGNITFSFTTSSTSENSQLMGIICNGALTINVSNITVRRNLIPFYETAYNLHINISQVNNAISNIRFSENFCGKSLYLTGQLNDIQIYNNIFEYQLSYWAFTISGSVTHNGIFKNNVLYWNSYWGTDILSLENFIIQNNIAYDISFTPNNNDYTFNIASNDAFGNQNGNQANVNLSTVFKGFSGSQDGQYQLKEGSPAIGAGVGGVDCGAFGGFAPYVLSGMPPVPAIYDFIIGNSESQYNVNLKIKSHK